MSIHIAESIHMLQVDWQTNYALPAPPGAQLVCQSTTAVARDGQDNFGPSPASRALIEAAARRPSPMARITVAAPSTMSPPA